MDTLAIRTATSDDVPALSALMQRTVRLSNAPDYGVETAELIAAGYTPDKIARRLAERDVFVCQMDDRLVGTISFAEGKLRSLFIEPSAQRLGVGARLVAHLEAHARAAGVVELTLSSSLTGRGFYERLGYRMIRFEERADGSTFLMSKILR